jgi:DNA invertase Pin-like site-specific DNA recombinase
MLLKKQRRPAAQYLRTSTSMQEFSFENQSAEIKRYADQFDYEVVQTYSDTGRTGVTLRHRKGLNKLLSDVLSGDARFEAILVYDISRWGRFQDDNEAGHYEFLCRRAGIAVHYCAEPFLNDNSLSSGLLKSLKRVMAKEYSREMGVKVYAGQERIARLGFKIGGIPGFGLRRIMVSKDGKYKGRLGDGDRKSLATDRVKLALGPAKEIQCVRRMFSMALLGMSSGEIARVLNKQSRTSEGSALWTTDAVRAILTHPKYTGSSVWGQRCEKLHAPSISMPRQNWIVCPGAFPGLIDVNSFEQVQRNLKRYASDRFWSDEEILAKLRHLWARKGKLSEWLIDNTTGMPTYSTIQARFGSLRRAYDLIGYRAYETTAAACIKKAQMFQLRNKLIQEIRALFPYEVIDRLPGKLRPILRLDNGTIACVRVCLARVVRKTIIWEFSTSQAENGFWTLLARSNIEANGVHSMYLLPPRRWASFYRFKGDPVWLTDGIRLKHLTDLPTAITRSVKREGVLTA